ncbi:MAG: aminopeptidase [Luteolibacter sp.]|uniref:aminopeptidase n=1 Tax=Luteolibacter sp. TaxID=1962973 RepID=UPI00326755B9
MPRFSTFVFSVFAALALSSCQTVHFYGQAVSGQYEILARSRSNKVVMADPASPPLLRRQLASIEEIRGFASDQLLLPGDESYGRYTDLGRPHVVWVLYAAPEFSLEPKTWFYPAIGEMDYRGYFHEDDTTALASQLRNEGYDVYVGGVDAYSTLGWFHDPVLNTFVDYPDIDLAETLFHELTHRKVFHRGDTVFNESLANAVAEEGVKRWLKFHGRDADLRKYEGRLVRRREFYHEIDIARANLKTLYASGQPASVMRSRKAAILEKLRDQFRELRRRWGGHGLESWLEEDLNNGHIVSLDLYFQQMPVFEKLLAECNGDLKLFFKKADCLKLP